MPDRAQVTMTSHFLRSYSLLLIKPCHRREIHAMGGMAAQIPIRDDPAANEVAMEKVRADKQREASDGHDGTLPRLMYGLTSCGAINFTECPNDCSSRAQWWLAPQASIAITVGASFSRNANISLRRSFCAEPAARRCPPRGAGKCISTYPYQFG